jgi:hypothetical protein
MVLVTSRWGRRGLATRLVHRCLAAANALKLTTWLDATPAVLRYMAGSDSRRLWNCGDCGFGLGAGWCGTRRRPAAVAARERAPGRGNPPSDHAKKPLETGRGEAKKRRSQG